MEFRDYKNLWKEEKLIDYMVTHLSEKNREEAELLLPTWTIREILEALSMSAEHGFALFDDKGDPYGMGGIASDGNIFFVVREELDMTQNISALKQARKWLAKRLRTYLEIWGYCWEKSTQSMEWMRWLGFDFAPSDSPANKTVGADKFIYFRIRRPRK